MPAGNPLLEPWSSALGLPPFDALKAEHFRPAFDAAIAGQKAAIAAITGSTEAPSFANTIVAVELSGLGLDHRLIHPLGSPKWPRAIQIKLLIIISESLPNRSKLPRHPANAGSNSSVERIAPIAGSSLVGISVAILVAWRGTVRWNAIEAFYCTR
jgi:hypothetical protein